MYQKTIVDTRLFLEYYFNVVVNETKRILAFYSTNNKNNLPKENFIFFHNICCNFRDFTFVNECINTNENPKVLPMLVRFWKIIVSFLHGTLAQEGIFLLMT